MRHLSRRACSVVQRKICLIWQKKAGAGIFFLTPHPLAHWMRRWGWWSADTVLAQPVLLPGPPDPSEKAVVSLCCLPDPLTEDLEKVKPFRILHLKALMLDDIIVESLVIRGERVESIYPGVFVLQNGMDSWYGVLLSPAFYFLCFGVSAWFKVSKLASYFH